MRSASATNASNRLQLAALLAPTLVVLAGIFAKIGDVKELGAAWVAIFSAIKVVAWQRGKTAAKRVRLKESIQPAPLPSSPATNVPPPPPLPRRPPGPTTHRGGRLDE
jgi:hypothetical protein